MNLIKNGMCAYDPAIARARAAALPRTESALTKRNTANDLTQAYLALTERRPIAATASHGHHALHYQRPVVVVRVLHRFDTGLVKHTKFKYEVQ